MFFQSRVLLPYPGLVHGIFTRCGGVSTGDFRELNTAYSTRDPKGCVTKNRAIISKTLNIQPLVFARQVHGNAVINVNGKAAVKGMMTSLNDEGDAMITCRQNRFLAIQTADCQSVLLYDPKNRAVGNVHSGWRSSINNIIGHTLDAMKLQFNTNPEDIVAAIGPSLGPCCAEFVNYKKEIPKRFWKYKREDHLFDFWTLSVDQLREKGVKTRHIDVSHMCTLCNTHLFYSYRGKKTTGRFCSVIGINGSSGN